MWARTVAEEITVNEFVKEPLPDGAIILGTFPDLPPMESTDQRYHRLEQEKNRLPLSTLAAMIAAGLGSTGSKVSGQNGIVVDDHSVWQEAQRDRERAQAALRAILQDAGFDVGSDKIPDYLRNTLQGMGIGHTPGDGQYDLSGGGRGSLDWVQFLRCYVGRELVIQPDFARPSRRFPALVGVVPGKRRSRRTTAYNGHHRHVRVDHAATVGVNQCRTGSACWEHRVTVVECDAEIRSASTSTNRSALYVARRHGFAAALRTESAPQLSPRLDGLLYGRRRPRT